jgi:hypothetical protein
MGDWLSTHEQAEDLGGHSPVDGVSPPNLPLGQGEVSEVPALLRTNDPRIGATK